MTAPPNYSAPNARGRKFILGGVVCAAAIVCVELASYPASLVLADRAVLYAPQTSRLTLSEYLANRDPDLGWPSARVLREGAFDKSGSRVVPAFPDPSVTPCASIYGDSFAWSEDVDAEHAWGNVLSRGLGCRVANYGAGGFGTDQAYMRYKGNQGDRSKVVILTHLSENIQRNLNRFRNLLEPADVPELKPRFVLNAAGELQLVSLYTPTSEADLRRVMEHPEVLPNEWFAPGGPSGVATHQFPYSLSVAHALSSYKVFAAFRRRPTHAQFYEVDHPAQGLQLSTAIAKAFAQEASLRGAAPLVVTIPLPPDFIDARKSGKWPYGPLVEELVRARVPVLDAGPLFEADLKGADPCSLYTPCAGGHFNENGYRLLAEYVRAWVTAHGSSEDS